MYSIRARAWLVSILALTTVCLAVTSPAQASVVVPWMTGDFSSPDNAFGFNSTGISYANKFFNMSFTVNVIGYNPSWCAYEDYCHGFASGTITGGNVTGNLYSNWLGQNQTLDATFKGWVTGGEVIGEYTSYQDYYWEWRQYSYTFYGVWTNGLATSGSANTSWSTDYWYHGTYSILTTSTPEPTSIALVGTGIMGLWSGLRRRR